MSHESQSSQRSVSNSLSKKLTKVVPASVSTAGSLATAEDSVKGAIRKVKKVWQEKNNPFRTSSCEDTLSTKEHINQEPATVDDLIILDDNVVSPNHEKVTFPTSFPTTPPSHAESEDHRWKSKEDSSAVSVKKPKTHWHIPPPSPTDVSNGQRSKNLSSNNQATSLLTPTKLYPDISKIPPTPPPRPSNIRWDDSCTNKMSKPDECDEYLSSSSTSSRNSVSSTPPVPSARSKTPPTPAPRSKFLITTEAASANLAGDASEECAICFTGRRNHVMVPCGHLFCEECANDQLKSGSCYVCEKEVIMITKVYF